MPYCPHCDAKLGDGLKSCPECGDELSTLRLAWGARLFFGVFVVVFGLSAALFLDRAFLTRTCDQWCYITRPIASVPFGPEVFSLALAYLAVFCGYIALTGRISVGRYRRARDQPLSGLK